MSGTIRSMQQILKTLFQRIGKNVTNVEFVADELSKRTIQAVLFGGVSATLYLVGHATGSDGSKHPVYKDPKTGKHYMADDSNQLHEVVG